MKWTTQRKAQAVSLYQSGLTLKHVALELQTSSRLVALLLDAECVQRRPLRAYAESYRAAARSRKPPTPRVWTEERRTTMAAQYLAGALQSELAATYETSQAQIWHQLKKAGVATPKRTGRRNSQWSGGRVIDKSGYALVHAPAHPQANSQGYVREHRLVMEQHLGRLLLRSERVHHRNLDQLPVTDRADNRIENLQLYASNGEHLREELTGRCPNWSEAGRARLAEAVRRPRKR